MERPRPIHSNSKFNAGYQTPQKPVRSAADQAEKEWVKHIAETYVPHDVGELAARSGESVQEAKEPEEVTSTDTRTDDQREEK